MDEKSKRTANALHIEINENYFDLPPDEQRDFLRNLLMGMSPNENVRSQAKKTSD